MPGQVAQDHQGMAVGPAGIAELAHERRGFPERVGDHPAPARYHLAQFAGPRGHGTPGRVREPPGVIPHTGRDDDSECVQGAGGACSPACGHCVADVKARVTVPRAGQPDLEQDTGHRARHGLSVVCAGHPVPVGERAHELRGHPAGVLGREYPERENLPRPDLLCSGLPRLPRAALLPAFASWAHRTRMPHLSATMAGVR